MHNCIFTSHCIESTCDKSCPMLVETSYLLERNNISMNSDVLKSPPRGWTLSKALNILESAVNSSRCVITQDTVAVAEYLTYCAICQNWQGSRLHCNVYNLRYSKYIETIKKSWTTKHEPEELEYMRIWVESAKVLIISNMDFVTFSDFECQTLLALLQSRKSSNKSTIIVSPRLSNLVGKGSFFNPLLGTLGEVSK